GYCQEGWPAGEGRAFRFVTGHNLHAPLFRAALQQGRRVFVEKPLCLDEVQLQTIIRAWQSAPAPYLMVGFNRRFAPLTAEIARFFSSCHEPMVMAYRVNAGALPPENWLQAVDEGGRRIIGEACHFIDWMSYVAGSPPVQVFAQALGERDGRNDNVVVTVTFRNGSVGSLHYLSNGDRSVPKEHIEVFCQGSVAVLEDFKR